MNATRPLAGLKVLELGALIVGPFCAKILAEFGPEVIKIEPPGQGDPLRKWRYVKDGTSVWWHVQSCGKKSVALDLRKPEGQAIARKLALAADIVVENFRPGTMEEWGMGCLAAARGRVQDSPALDAESARRNPQSDREDFSRLWDGFCPDEIKIYPNQLLANAELYDYWQRGEFHPYTTAQLIDLIADVKPTIPRYCRVNRVIRDIPSTNVVEGNRRTSLRQDIHAEMKRRGTQCQCVRSVRCAGK